MGGRKKTQIMTACCPLTARTFVSRCLWYEVSLCIKTGEICWVNGGYPSGEKNDNVIFQDALVDEPEEGEHVETDMGYRASALKYVKCPGTIWTEAEKKEMQSRVRARQETVNLRMKSWNIPVAPYRHSVYQHQHFFSGCCGAHPDFHSKWRAPLRCRIR